MPIPGNTSSAGKKPTTPVIGTATAGSGSASVAFTASTYTGKETITYTASSNPGSITGTGSTSPVTVSGLSSGTPYTFNVFGTTNYGVVSDNSAFSNSVTPTTPPPPPPPPPPVECTTQNAYVTGISPGSGAAGSTVTISGFFPVQVISGSRVANVGFGATNSPSFSATESSITVTVPSISNGTYGVQVYNGCTPLMSELSFTVSSVPTPPPPTPPPPPPPTPPPPTPTACCQDTGTYFCCGSFSMDACWFQYDPCASTTCPIRVEPFGCG